MNLDGVAFDLLLPAVDRLLKLFAAKNGFWPLHKFVQQRELPGSYLHFDIRVPDLVLHRIKPHRAGLQHRLSATRMSPS